MGIIELSPAAFELTVVNERERLTFGVRAGDAEVERGDGSGAGDAGGAAEDNGPQRPRVPWLRVEALELEALTGAATTVNERGVQQGTDLAVARFQTRRLSVRAATLAVDAAVLQAGVATLPFGAEGIVDARLRIGAALGARLTGRFGFGGRTAAFTIRVGIEAPADARRRVRLDFSDVRLFAPLPVPGPLVGVAMARIIGDAAAHLGVTLQVGGPWVELDPLEISLIFALVSEGWRLPDVRHVRLRAPTYDKASLRLEFVAEDPFAAGPVFEDGDRGPYAPARGPLAFLEGERVPPALADADQLLFAGDLSGAERAYREALSALPDDRAAQTRLLALLAAANSESAGELAGALVARWPDYVPALLYAAASAVAGGQAARAAGIYDRIATLTEARGEREDAALARVAAAEPELAGPPPSGPTAQPPDEESVREADDLTARGRTLASGGDGAGAATTWEQALALVPAHADALGLLADQAFQAKDWERARQFYAALDGAPDAADVISRDVLVFRRAIVARATGDADEAERWYRELAILTPRHIETRQALAQLALERNDLAEAAARLEEVLRLLPRDAIALLTDVREHLAEIYVGLGDWNVARHYLELVLAHDPGRVQIIERLTEVYEHLDLQPALVDALERLARLSIPTRRRAAALWRQGEILRERMHDEGRAFDAYLRSSDLDPSFPPTALRLLGEFWQRGQLADVAAVGDDLLRAGALPADLVPALRLRLAIAFAVRSKDAERAATAVKLASTPWDEALAQTTLNEALQRHLLDRSAAEREAAEQVVAGWRNIAAAESGAEPSLDAGA